MMQIQFDKGGPFTVRFPKRYQQAEIINLAQTFIAYEQTLPSEQRSPYLEMIITLLEQILAERDVISRGEATRLTTSEVVKRWDEQAKQLIAHIAQVVRAAVFTEPARAQGWGFKVRQSTGKMRLPINRRERLALLDAYLAKEKSRSEAERFAIPTLQEVQQVRDELAANLVARHTAQTQREGGIAARNEASQALMHHLQAAAVYLLASRFNFKLTPELEYWGFEVVGRRRSSPAHNDENDTGDAGRVTKMPAEVIAITPGMMAQSGQNGAYYPAEGL